MRIQQNNITVELLLKVKTKLLVLAQIMKAVEVILKNSYIANNYIKLGLASFKTWLFYLSCPVRDIIFIDFYNQHLT